MLADASKSPASTAPGPARRAGLAAAFRHLVDQLSFGPSTEIVRRCQRKSGEVQSLDGAGHDVHSAVFGLRRAFNKKEGLGRDFETPRFKQIWPDDDIADARFVFKADKANTLGRAGALAANTLPGHSNHIPSVDLF